VNVVGTVYTINAFLPLLKNGALKKVITLSTGAGDLDFTFAAKYAINAPYSVSKAALNMVNSKYAVRYADEGFIFAAVSPGLVNTQTGDVSCAYPELSFKLFMSPSN
jgi:NAD(P)-dependent dehydrogenase (short-subunit alcohol dehydrogenase family)